MITGLGSAVDLASGKKGAFYNTLEEFHKYWERIDIVTPKIKGQTSGLKEFFGNVYVHISPWPLWLHPIFFLKKSLEIYKKQKFNLMTVHDFPPFYNGIGARLLWNKIKVPYILEILHVPGYPRASGFREIFYKFIFKVFIKLDSSKAKAVRVMNQTQVPEFLIKHGVPKDKILCIPAIYVDLDVFKPLNLRKDYDLIFVGRLESNKGVDLFLETVRRLSCKAIIIGTGSLSEQIKSKIKNWNLDINFYGWARTQKEIAELLNRSKILVMPSYNEGGPRVAVEALACGVPVLATPVGIVPDLLKNLSAGRQVASGGEIIDWEADDIARKAEGLLNTPDKYQEYSNSGPELAGQFEKRIAIKNYAEKLKSLI